MTYSEKLKDPRWQKKRLEILNRDEWTCQKCHCTSKTLHVHHRYYEADCEPWDYMDHILVTLCIDCHEEEESSKKDANGIVDEFRSKGFFNTDIRALIYDSNLDKKTIEDLFYYSSCRFRDNDEYFSDLKSVIEKHRHIHEAKMDKIITF